MTNTVKPAGQAAGFPRHVTASMRAELPSLAEEIIAEIRRAIPEYARPMDGPYGEALRLGVHQALTTFVDLVADPSAPRDSLREVCRRLGQYEAWEGRSLDSLQAAYRVGSQVAWRRVMKVGQRGNLSSSVMSALADAIFSYMNEVAALSVEGYREAQAQSGEARQEWRRRLLRLILERPPVPRKAITGLAGIAGWEIPESVTMVAVQPAAAPGEDGCARPTDVAGDAGVAGVAGVVGAAGPHGVSLIDNDVLADLNCTQPHLLIPGSPTKARKLMLTAALAGRRLAVGLTVPLEAAADSLRWAQRALTLAESGVIDGDPVTLCEDHLVTLWLMSDPALAEQIIARQLGELAELTPRQRTRVIETLAPWLETRGTATEIASLLNVHPQTVRHRIRQFEQTFGGRLCDPDARFALELALRMLRLRKPEEGAAGPAGPAGQGIAAASNGAGLQGAGGEGLAGQRQRGTVKQHGSPR